MAASNQVSDMTWTKEQASTKRTILDISLFESNDPTLWEAMYRENMEHKYHKGTRGFNQAVLGTSTTDSLIYIIPRVRGGPGYKSVELAGVDRSKVQYCPISKGYPMQDVSSFTVGPIVGEGLCLVNAAFSKTICIAHLEGGGFVNLKRKSFWQRSRTPPRSISFRDGKLTVNGIDHDVYEWLSKNESLWYEEWYKWCRSVALCSRGDFHWSRGLDERVAFHNSFTNRRGPKYVDFVTWKKECYIRPSYEYLPSTTVYQFLHELKEKKVPIGLVHPMGYKGVAEVPLTEELIRDLFDSAQIMSCQPYVVVGLLLGVPIYE